MIQEYNMISNRGNPVPNQIVIYDTCDLSRVTFRSYDTIIAVIDTDLSADIPQRKITLDCTHNYSITTAKYRNQFLNMTSKEVEQGIKKGEIKVTDLNSTQGRKED
jgi:hypothetical protein